MKNVLMIAGLAAALTACGSMDGGNRGSQNNASGGASLEQVRSRGGNQHSIWCDQDRRSSCERAISAVCNGPWEYEYDMLSRQSQYIRTNSGTSILLVETGFECRN